MFWIREVRAGETPSVAGALRVLRPRFGSDDELVDRVDRVQRPDGYRLVGAFVDGRAEAVAVAGFRLLENLAWGRFLYVDDLSTLPEARRTGAARALMVWLEEEAQRLSCDQLHLDSGTLPERAAAHALYFRSGMRISSHHFEKLFGPTH